jgi:hypothetical protein
VITRGIRRNFRLFFKNCMAVHAKEARKRKQAKMARPRLATPPGVAALAAAAGAAAQRIVGWPLRLHTEAGASASPGRRDGAARCHCRSDSLVTCDRPWTGLAVMALSRCPGHAGAASSGAESPRTRTH